MKKPDIEYYTTGLLLEFAEFVIQNFGGVVTIEDFVEIFSELFIYYKKEPYKEKLDIEILQRERAISCSTATVIAGIWYLLEHEGKPKYYIERVPKERETKHIPQNKGKRKMHTAVVIGDQLFEVQLDLNDPSKIEFNTLPLTHARTQKITDPGNLLYRTIPSTASFLANRVSLFDLNQKTKERLGGRHELITQFVENYQAFLYFIRMLADEQHFQ